MGAGNRCEYGIFKAHRLAGARCTGRRHKRLYPGKNRCGHDDRRKAALTVAVWILLGAVGIPVYSGGRGGLSELVGPTGGFIFAFLVAAYLISRLKGKEFSLPRYLLVTLCIGIPVIDLAGAAWYKFYADIGWGTALLTTALPFLPGDIIKGVAATLLAKPIAIALSKLRRPSAA